MEEVKAVEEVTQEPKEFLDANTLYNQLDSAVFKAPLTGQERLDANKALRVFAYLLRKEVQSNTTEKVS